MKKKTSSPNLSKSKTKPRKPRKDNQNDKLITFFLDRINREDKMHERNHMLADHRTDELMKIGTSMLPMLIALSSGGRVMMGHPPGMHSAHGAPLKLQAMMSAFIKSITLEQNNTFDQMLLPAQKEMIVEILKIAGVEVEKRPDPVS